MAARPQDTVPDFVAAYAMAAMCLCGASPMAGCSALSKRPPRLLDRLLLISYIPLETKESPNGSHRNSPKCPLKTHPVLAVHIARWHQSVAQSSTMPMLIRSRD